MGQHSDGAQIIRPEVDPVSERRSAQSKRRETKLREELMADRGSRCALWKYSRLPSNLHFHHLDRGAKKFALSGAALLLHSNAVIQAEAMKCELLCTNCHHGVEAGQIALRGRRINYAQLHALSKQPKCRNHGVQKPCACSVRSKMRETRLKVIRTLLHAHGGACRACGLTEPAAALQFHHLDPATKSFNIGAARTSKGVQALLHESRKCLLLCANCHGEVEAGILQVEQESSFSPDRLCELHFSFFLQDRTRVEELYKETAGSPKAMAETLGCTKETIRKALLKHGIVSRRAPKEPAYCRVCEAEISRSAIHCSAHQIIVYKANWPADEILIEMVARMPMVAVGRALGVSDNAVRKRLKKRKLLMRSK